jgi:hypothetical protein
MFSLVSDEVDTVGLIISECVIQEFNGWKFESFSFL